MNGRHILLLGAGAAALLGGVGGAQAKEGTAAATPNLHITHHLRVDGSSDLRGVVRARSGLHVTAGLTTDTLSASGPVQLSGILTVSGQITAAGLNTGGGGVTTGGSIQGSSLSVSGDASVGGNLLLTKTLTANDVSVGSGGLQASAISAGNINSSGTISASSFNTGGALTAGSITDSGSLTAGSGTFSRLSISTGGSVNFNNASISGVAGLSLTGNATLSSLQITTPSSGGAGGTQPFLITQNGQTASLSVSPAAVLTVGGAGLATPTLTVSGNASLGGTLTTSHIVDGSRLTLDAPTVATTNDLEIQSTGNLRLDSNGATTAVHILGNHDTRGQCSVTAPGPPGIGTCGVSFVDPYGSAPIVVVTPTNLDPSFVTGFSVQSSSGGFTIRFTTLTAGTVTFNYVVEG